MQLSPIINGKNVYCDWEKSNTLYIMYLNNRFIILTFFFKVDEHNYILESLVCICRPPEEGILDTWEKNKSQLTFCFFSLNYLKPNSTL